MLPPSATAGEAVRVTVLASTVSVMVVTAAAGLRTRFSKLPPLAPVMVTDTEPASRYTSSVGAATGTEPLLVLARMVIVAPFESVTVTSLCAGALRVAV